MKTLPANAGNADLIPGSGRSPGIRCGVFLPGESNGQGSLVGYSPGGRRESDTTEMIEHSRTCEAQAPVLGWAWHMV